MVTLFVVDAPPDVALRLERAAREIGLPFRDAGRVPYDPRRDGTPLWLIYGSVGDGRIRATQGPAGRGLKVAVVDGLATPGQAVRAGFDDALHVGLCDDVLEMQLATLAEHAAACQAQGSEAVPPPESWAEYKLETLGGVVGGIAHDFNNLLTTVLANAKLLERGLDGLRDVRSLEGHLAQIERAARKAAALTDDLLVYAGRRQIHPRSTDLAGVVRSVAGKLEASMPPGLRLQLDLAPSLPQVRCDPEQIGVALEALVTNAVEAAGDGGTIRIRAGCIKLARAPEGAFASRGAGPGNYAFLQVADDGPGIARAHLPRVLDPFFTTKPAARGLGLALVLGITRAHRGAIEIESESGQGTVVRILLPLDLAEASASSSPSLPVVRDQPGVTVLLADDEPQLLSTLDRLLRQFDFRVLSVSSGREALARLRSNPHDIDVLLLDLGLPDLPGVRALAEVRSVAPSVPVVFMSGTRDADADAAIVQDPRAEFVLKPFDPVTLVRRLGELAQAGHGPH